MADLYRGRSISRGLGEGETLVTTQPLSFTGGVDPDSGIVTERGHELFGKKVSGKVLIMPPLKGSTASTWIMARLSDNGLAPRAIIVTRADIILTAGAIIGKIPTVDNFGFDPTLKFKAGQRLRVNGDEGTVEVCDQTEVSPPAKHSSSQLR
jgi:predicted aconitase with swiveling domain